MSIRSKTDIKNTFPTELPEQQLGEISTAGQITRPLTDIVDSMVPELLQVPEKTGDVLLDRFYGTLYGITTPETGDIVIDTTGAVPGGHAIIRHNDSTEPSISGVTKLSNGFVYTASADNYIIIKYLSSSVIVASTLSGNAAGSAGVTDHGGLSGLGDDDHSQYHNDTRGDARYLYRENTAEFVPDGDYEPATKKYVDDAVTAGGTPDHGNLLGLSDDDHPQYHNDTRGDARYLLITQRAANDGVASLDSSGKVPVGQLPSGIITQVDVVADITARDALPTPAEADVAIVLDNGSAVQEAFIYDGSAWQTLNGVTFVVDHGSLSGLGDDDHTQYFNETRGDARYVTIASKGVASGVAPLDASVKLLLSYLAQNGATSGQVLAWNGSAWAPSTISVSTTAASVSYDNTTSGLDASNVKAALDELTSEKQDTSEKDQPNGYAGLDANQQMNPTLRLSQAGATAGQVLKWNGVGWFPADDTAGGAATAAGTSYSNATSGLTATNVQAGMDELVTLLPNAQTVADITARDAISPTRTGMFVKVTDAGSGSPGYYVRDNANTGWIEIVTSSMSYDEVADITARDALTSVAGDISRVADDGSGYVAFYIYDGVEWDKIFDGAALIIGTVASSRLTSSGNTIDVQSMTPATLTDSANPSVVAVVADMTNGPVAQVTFDTAANGTDDRFLAISNMQRDGDFIILYIIQGATAGVGVTLEATGVTFKADAAASLSFPLTLSTTVGGQNKILVERKSSTEYHFSVQELVTVS